MLKNRINIIFLILAFTLNFAHDILLHEHHEHDLFSISHTQSQQHFHDNNTECSHSENEEQELPFQHRHLEHGHDNVLLRNTQISIDNTYYSEYIHSVFSLQDLDINQFDYFQTDKDISYHKIIFLSISLRAPPTIS
jgi:hypothetical protein